MTSKMVYNTQIHYMIPSMLYGLTGPAGASRPGLQVRGGQCANGDEGLMEGSVRGVEVVALLG
jgi:hypothetical protein